MHALTFEFARADQAEDPLAFRCVRQVYVLRRDRGFGSAELPWGPELLNALAELQRPSPEPSVVHQLGEMLRTFLADSLRQLEGWGFYEGVIQRAAETGELLRIVFRFAAAELYALPWELVTLRATGQHLGELPGCLVQYEWPGAKGPPPATAPPEQERLLFGWSAAGGQVPVDAHLQALQGDVPRDVLGDLSLSSLQQHLAGAGDSGRPVTMLHLLSHRTQTAGGTHGLLWSPAPGGDGPELVDGAALRRVLEPHRHQLRLVVLCACQGPQGGPLTSALGGLAQAIHRIGVPAVIAFRLPLSLVGSVRFSEAFYGSFLGERAPLERALLAARSSLTRHVGFDWASLQIYARSGDPEAREAPPPSLPAGAEPAREHAAPAAAGARRRLSWIALPLGVVLLALAARWLGGLAEEAREDLFGLDPDRLTYPESELWGLGAKALLRLPTLALLDIWAGTGVERWGAVVVAAAAAGWIALARSRFRRATLVASGVGTLALAGAVTLYAAATQIHHVVVPDRTSPWSCAPAGGERWTVPDQVAFEVCSWLRNEHERNARRALALAGLWGWLAAACAVAVWAPARARADLGRGAAGVSLGLVAAAGLIGVLHLRQAPRASAVATWDRAYPRVVELSGPCAVPELSRALGSRDCRVLDVFADARPRILLVLCAQGPVPAFVELPQAPGDGACRMKTQGYEPVFDGR